MCDALEFQKIPKELENKLLLLAYYNLLTYIYMLDEKTCTYDYLLNLLKDYNENDIYEKIIYLHTLKNKENGVPFKEFFDDIESEYKRLKSLSIK